MRLMHWLIATDLDGTLLDDGYPIEAAAAAIDSLSGLPPVSDGTVTLQVVLATSKTLAEGIPLASQCESQPILGFENGAGLAWPTAACARRGTHRQDGYEIECTGTDYRGIRKTLLRLRVKPEYRFRGFGDMSPVEVAQRTGLDEDAATAAMQRMASEPLIWQGTASALRSFERDLDDLGLNLNLGGRFHHVTGCHDKAGAVAAIRQRLAHGQRGAIVTLACGDAPNDMEMLRAADFALVFPDGHGGYVLPEDATVSHAPGPGPEAWLKGVSRVIQFNSPEVDSI